jgi:cold shock CspA family protein
MSEGITTHYLPLKSYNGYRQEKDIDVWLALEAFELAFYKHFDVLVLIASDGNFVPLIRKLNTLGTRVMVLSWEFEYTTDNGQTFVTRTSQDLLDQVSYPVAMHELIDNPRRKTDVLINNLFVSPPGKRAMGTPLGKGNPDALNGEILSLKTGFGFIRYPPNNLFFHYTSVVDDDFNDLRVGDLVEFNLGKNDVGEDIAQEVRLVD